MILDKTDPTFLCQMIKKRNQEKMARMKVRQGR